MDLEKTVGFLSNHFELILYLFLACAIIVIVLLLVLKLSDFKARDAFFTTLQNIIYITAMSSLLLLVSLAGYVYWTNYYSLAEIFEFPKDVSPNTHWINDSSSVYFIDGNELKSIQINGQNAQSVFAAKDPIREYVFSPDGKNLLINTYQSLYLLPLKTRQSILIDSVTALADNSLATQKSDEKVKGAISGAHWSPDSKKFCYEISRWSQYLSKDQIYIYDLEEKNKRAIDSPVRKSSALYWDKKGENLYNLYQEAVDTSLHDYSYEIKVSRISLTTLQSELVAQIASNQSTVPVDHLLLRDIKLFLEGDRLRFNSQSQSRERFVSDAGKLLGIDKDDHLYFVNDRWFRKRLFKIPRHAVASEIPRYQYKGGDLTVQDIRWLPGSRFAMLDHHYLGVLILEPATNKIGQLVEINGHTIGWYTDISKEIDSRKIQEIPSLDEWIHQRE